MLVGVCKANPSKLEVYIFRGQQSIGMMEGATACTKEIYSKNGLAEGASEFASMNPFDEVFH